MGLKTTDIFKQLQNKNEKLKKLSDSDLKKLQKTLLEMVCDFDKVCTKNQINYHLTGGSCLGAVRHNGFIPWDDDVDIDMPRKDYEKLKKVFKKELGEKYDLQSIDTNPTYDLIVPKMRKKGTIYRTKDDVGNEDAGIAIELCIIENTYNFIIMRWVQGMLSLTFGLINSCRNFYGKRKVFLEMAGEDKKIRRIFKIKISLGFLFAWRTERSWAKTWDKVNKMCKNEKSKLVVVPVGRKHFFGEMYKREDFCEGVRHEFGGQQFLIPKEYDKYLKQMYGDYRKIPAKNERETHTVFELEF
ncbi:LicD family protein [Candidatus Saccharibacteria bacterium]|nr:LicD family protein [Candidatus Saccharibacteria bacterium]